MTAEIIRDILEHYDVSTKDVRAMGGVFIQSANDHDAGYYDALIDQGMLTERDTLRDRFSRKPYYALTVEGEVALEVFKGIDSSVIEHRAKLAGLDCLKEHLGEATPTRGFHAA